MKYFILFFILLKVAYSSTLASNLVTYDGPPLACDPTTFKSNFLASHPDVVWMDTTSGSISSPDRCHYNFIYRYRECPVGQEFNLDTYSCDVPIPSCSDGQHYSTDDETCICNVGYSASYDVSGNLVCEPPVCPGMYQGLPHFNTVDSVADCNFFQMSDGAALERPDGKICCYGQSAIDDNNTCPDNEVNIDGVCYPIEHDDNDTDHQCGEGQYWSIYSNSCVDWFPENNDTNITGNQGGGSGTGDGTNGAGRDSKVSDSTMGDLFGGEMSNSEYSDGLQGFGERAINKVKEAMNSYVLIHLPINVSGECGQNLRANFSILGKSYHIDLQDQFAEINQYNSQIYALVMFLFAISGVVLVLSGGKE